jgi:hypothetical protein
MTAALLLMGAYYVFDLDYPGIYAQVLSILQHWVVGDNFTQSKGTMDFSDQFRLAYAKNKNCLQTEYIFFLTGHTRKEKTNKCQKRNNPNSSF